MRKSRELKAQDFKKLVRGKRLQVLLAVVDDGVMHEVGIDYDSIASLKVQNEPAGEKEPAEEPADQNEPAEENEPAEGNGRGCDHTDANQVSTGDIGDSQILLTVVDDGVMHEAGIDYDCLTHCLHWWHQLLMMGWD